MIGVLCAVLLVAQSPAAPAKPMGEPLSAFVGQWEGKSEGASGSGTSERSYAAQAAVVSDACRLVGGAPGSQPAEAGMTFDGP